MLALVLSCFHSTPNGSSAQYVIFARSNNGCHPFTYSDRTTRQILRRLFRGGGSHIADSPLRRPHPGGERALQEENGRQVRRDRVGDMRAVLPGGREVSGHHGDILEF